MAPIESWVVTFRQHVDSVSWLKCHSWAACLYTLDGEALDGCWSLCLKQSRMQWPHEACKKNPPVDKEALFLLWKIWCSLSFISLGLHYLFSFKSQACLANWNCFLNSLMIQSFQRIGYSGIPSSCDWQDLLPVLSCRLWEILTLKFRNHIYSSFRRRHLLWIVC